VKYSSKNRSSVEFKGFEIPSLRALLREASPSALQETLERMCQQQPDFFGWQPVVIDLTRLGDETESLDWPAILNAFRSAQLHPVSVCGAPESFRERADSLCLGLVDLPDTASHSGRVLAHPQPAHLVDQQPTQSPLKSAEPVEHSPQTAPPPPTPSESSSGAAPGPLPILDAMIIDRPIRSGQQIYARDRDLIVMAVVSPGAEVIADGNVHVYGSLAGRAIAGARGRRDARIFTLDLRAEIVAVAGLYKTFEEGVPENLRGKPVQIALGAENADALEIRPI
jgi:septum site-determining protein MinC